MNFMYALEARWWVKIRLYTMWLLLIVASVIVPPQAFAQCYFLECDQRPNGPAPTPTPSSPIGRSYWNHNGSIMYLLVSGNTREFYYDKPRQGLIDEGVRPGTLLFSGTVSGDRYEGTAYLFSARCGSRPYRVSGVVQESGGRVVMTGNASLLNKHCQVTRSFEDILAFNFLHKD